jgi:hypothetical protein
VSYSSIVSTFTCWCSFTTTTSDCTYSFALARSCEPTTSFATHVLAKPTKKQPGKKKQKTNKIEIKVKKGTENKNQK